MLGWRVGEGGEEDLAENGDAGRSRELLARREGAGRGAGFPWRNVGEGDADQSRNDATVADPDPDREEERCETGGICGSAREVMSSSMPARAQPPVTKNAAYANAYPAITSWSSDEDACKSR